MRTEDNCRDWKTVNDHRVPEPLVRNACCHICGGVFTVNTYINWHPDELKGCHKECRDSLPKPEPTPEESEKRYDANDESSDRQRFEDERAEREFTIYGQPKWNDYDDSMLEEMWEEGKSIEEIADALTRRLPHGYERSKGAVRSRIKKLGIEEKTGRYFRSSDRVYGNQVGINGSGRKYPRWNDDDVLMLEEMWKEGKSIEEIANRLDRTEGAIEHKIRTEKIDEKTGRCLPPSDKQLHYLKSLGYQEIPTCRKEAMEKIEEMLNKPTSTTFEAELRATGYTGSIPKTNQETLDAIWERQDPTENQINLLKRICAALGKEFEMPLNKLEASKTIDLLKQEASSKQIRIPSQRRRSRLKEMVQRTEDEDDEDEDDEDDEDDDEYYEYDDDGWDEELGSHETDDDKRGDETSGTLEWRDPKH